MAKASRVEQTRSKVTTLKQPGSNTVGKSVDLNQMIREAAYYRAEQRGFVGGDALEDWLCAEEEVLKKTN